MPRLFLALLTVLLPLAVPGAGQQAVTTHHYDNHRTGWNSHETSLTPAAVAGSTFGLLTTVALDDQVDAQPLVVPGVNITAGNFQGTHDVVYVATESNSVYAIDAQSGTILLKANFGTAVHYPLGCANNGPNVGITSTPVIDLSGGALYVMAYTQDSSGPAYRLHALDLGSLVDKVAPRLVAATHKLSDGASYSFNATYQRQRPALLLANGNVYAGFGSFCDSGQNIARGWLIAWNAATLVALPAKQLMDTQASDTDTYFLSSIWMSGFGPAADNSGNIFFVTGNSDNDGTTYDGMTNLQESVVKVSSPLSKILSLFTPSNQASLDQADADFGSGGITLLPDQPGSVPHMAVAAGKRGVLFLMNTDKLGGYSATKNNVLGNYGIGECWCGQSYFQDPSDGLGRVVTSGGRTVGIWKLATSPKPALAKTMSSASVGGGQDPGFFTTVSSNGTGSPVIWAISRPLSHASPAIHLFAFDPETSGTTMQQLFAAPAGSWPHVSGDANLVPVVANGEVFVASYQQLQIFGLKTQILKRPERK